MLDRIILAVKFPSILTPKNVPRPCFKTEASRAVGLKKLTMNKILQLFTFAGALTKEQLSIHCPEKARLAKSLTHMPAIAWSAG